MKQDQMKMFYYCQMFPESSYARMVFVFLNNSESLILETSRNKSSLTSMLSFMLKIILLKKHLVFQQSQSQMICYCYQLALCFHSNFQRKEV